VESDHTKAGKGGGKRGEGRGGRKEGEERRDAIAGGCS
jgi:hypothetical protein